MIDAHCIMVQFSCQNINDVKPHDLSFSLNMCNCDGGNAKTTIADESEMKTFEDDSVDESDIRRDTPSMIELHASMFANNGQGVTLNQLKLDVSLVLARKDCDQYECIGAKIFHESDCLLTHKFAHPFSIDKKEDKFQAFCNKVNLIYSNDGKMNNELLGIGSCSKSYSCNHCIRPTNSKDFPTYLEFIAKNEMG